MINIQGLVDHICNEIGVSDQANYTFKYGYLVGFLQDLSTRVPEVREALEKQARMYKYQEIS